MYIKLYQSRNERSDSHNGMKKAKSLYKSQTRDKNKNANVSRYKMITHIHKRETSSLSMKENKQ